MPVAQVKSLPARKSATSSLPRPGGRAPAPGSSAKVISTEPLILRLTGRDDDVSLPARRAVSCLVQPAEGDEVLFCTLEDGRTYVLAVLERELATSPVPLAIEGDCTLQATGTLGLVGAEGVKIASGEELDMVAGRLSMRAHATVLGSEVLQVVSRALTVELERARVAAKTVDSFFDRLTQKAKSSLRIVEELDQVRAGRIDQVATDTMTLHSDNAVVTARQLVKVDAGQIQLG